MGNKKMFKKSSGNTSLFSRKTLCICVVILFVLSLLPILVISRYNHPSADDFSYGDHTFQTWKSTHSIIETMSVAGAVTKNIYYAWQGTFSAVFLMALNPSIFGDSLYMLVPIGLIALFIFAVAFFLKVVLVDYLNADKYIWCIFSVIICFLSMQFMISPVQGFFWYNSAMYYTGFYSAALIQFALILQLITTDNKIKAAVYAVLVTILSIIIGGGNFIVALLSAEIAALALVCCVIFRRDRLLKLLPCFFMICAAFLVNILAPGNFIRQQNNQGMGAIEAITSSFQFALDFIKNFVRAPVYIAIIGIMPAIYKITRDSKYSFRLPVFVTILLYCVYASTFTPSLYAMSYIGPERVLNINYFVFVIALFLAAVYWCGWVSKRAFSMTAKSSEKRTEISKYAEPVVVGILVLCFAFGCFAMIRENVDSIMSLSVVRSLVRGDANTYHQEYLSRLEIYNDPKIAHMEIPAFTVKPKVLFFDDITDDASDWKNVALAGFYSKETAVLIE